MYSLPNTCSWLTSTIFIRFWWNLVWKSLLGSGPSRGQWPMLPHRQSFASTCLALTVCQVSANTWLDFSGFMPWLQSSKPFLLELGISWLWSRERKTARPTMNNWIVFKSKDKVVMSLKGLLSKGSLSDN